MKLTLTILFLLLTPSIAGAPTTSLYRVSWPVVIMSYETKGHRVEIRMDKNGKTTKHEQDI